MSHSVRSHRQQPTRLLCPWDSPGKNTGVGCHSLLQCVKVKSLSRLRLLATPWTVAYQAPPSTGFPRQEYRGGLLFPSPIYIYIFFFSFFLMQDPIKEYGAFHVISLFLKSPIISQNSLTFLFLIF